MVDTFAAPVERSVMLSKLQSDGFMTVDIERGEKIQQQKNWRHNISSSVYF